MPRSDDHSTGDARQPYSEQGGTEGRHAQTHNVQREHATRSTAHDHGPDEFAGDLVSDHTRNQRGDHSSSASDDKQLRTQLPDLDSEDLNRLLVLDAGTPLDQGSVYGDLTDLQRGPFKAIGSQEASAATRYVAKRDTDYELWDRLVGQGRTAVVEHPGEHT